MLLNHSGLCPDWEDWNPKNAVNNATEAMDAAEQWLDVPQVSGTLSLLLQYVDFEEFLYLQ